MSPMHGSRPPANRPGIPPEIVTWADPVYLQRLEEDIAALRGQAEVVVASFHWGLHKEVLHYMTEIAHRAIDAGADLVIGHGPHYSLPVEVYKGVPIFYGLGSFSFHTGHGGRAHGDWLGMMVRVSWDRTRIAAGGVPIRPARPAQPDRPVRAGRRGCRLRRDRAAQRRPRRQAHRARRRGGDRLADLTPGGA